MADSDNEPAGPTLPEQLITAAEHIESLSHSELQLLLRQAAIVIRDLHQIVRVPDAIWF